MIRDRVQRCMRGLGKRPAAGEEALDAADGGIDLLAELSAGCDPLHRQADRASAVASERSEDCDDFWQGGRASGAHATVPTASHGTS